MQRSVTGDGIKLLKYQLLKYFLKYQLVEQRILSVKIFLRWIHFRKIRQAFPLRANVMILY